MKQPFTTRHIREFGDGTCQLVAENLRPGFTTGQLLDYVLTRKADAGAVHPFEPLPGQRAEYRNGKFTNTFIIPEKPIKRLTIFGGYHIWDYVFEI